ncbi:MAG: glycoside hydrolase family 28 protein [Bifidobacteriaceae bacterium]|nr:glycoside hydrolase family 28 protein [Bifidobacteriaceae bacterium]
MSKLNKKFTNNLKLPIFYLKDFNSIQNALDEIATAGGGELVIPQGKYKTGPLNLPSNLKLNLQAGCVLQFCDDFAIYPPVFTRWEGVNCYAFHPLIWADGQTNITICGEGIIDGKGQKWWQHFNQAAKNNQTDPVFSYELAIAKLNPGWQSQPSGGGRRETQFLRPPLIQFKNCQNISISGITLKNSPFWTLHILYSDKIIIQNIKVYNPADAITTDAVDIDSSTNTLIENCLFDVGDDAITLKSGSGWDGKKVGLPTENVIARNCKVLASHGGIAIGSETAGDIKNVLVENCQFDGTMRAIRLKSRRGRGGKISDIRLVNLKMNKNLCPIVLGMYFQPGANLQDPNNRWLFIEKPQIKNAMTPQITNITITNVEAKNCLSQAGYIVGLPESPIKNVVIKDFIYSLAKQEYLQPTVLTENDAEVYRLPDDEHLGRSYKKKLKDFGFKGDFNQLDNQFRGIKIINAEVFGLE